MCTLAQRIGTTLYPHKQTRTHHKLMSSVCVTVCVLEVDGEALAIDVSVGDREHKNK